MQNLQEAIYELVDKRFNIKDFIDEGDGTGQKCKNTAGIHCPMCKSDNVFVYLNQSRSADEEKTKYYECLDCNHKWKV